MSAYEFQVEEVKRGGYIAWDAIEARSGDRFPVNESEPYFAGTFPEISDYLKERGINIRVSYAESTDSFDGATWRYKRGALEVFVHDIPRTILRVGFGG